MNQWFQTEIKLPAFSRGCHLITRHVISQVPQLQQFQVGLMHVFIRHTSASLTLNENADPDVLTDMNMALNKLAPESWPYVHTCEGPDDMPAHIKATITGCSVSIPISNGQLLTGTWQGIYLCEHRNRASGRRLVITIQGEIPSA
jgi:secondary thiamine-phosphate synthase enzyme